MEKTKEDSIIGEETLSNRISKLKEKPEYRNSILVSLLAKQLEIGRRPFLAATDIDGTWYVRTQPGESREKILRESTEETLQFLNENHIPLGASTGRDLESVFAEQRKGNLPAFAFLVTAVGTEIWVRQIDGHYLLDKNYEAAFKDKFPRSKIYELLNDLKEKIDKEDPQLGLVFQARDKEENVSAWAGISAQYQNNSEREEAAKKQNLAPRPEPYKISFYFNAASLEEIGLVSSKFHERLNKAELGHLKVIISKSSYGPKTEDGQSRYYIDVVPVSKGDAISYLAQISGALTIAAGDAGNDELMLKAADLGVVVGNTKPELTEALDQIKPEKQTSHFKKFKDEQGKLHLLYIDDSSKGREGPESLVRAIHAFSILKSLQ